MWGRVGVIARCGSDITSSPRLRLSPLEIFPQRQFQPILPRIPGRLAVAFAFIVLHCGPVRMNGASQTQAPENRPTRDAALKFSASTSKWQFRRIDLVT